jgi:hypothetical protein
MVASGGDPGGPEDGPIEAMGRSQFNRRRFLGGSALVGTAAAIAYLTGIPETQLLEAFESQPSQPATTGTAEPLSNGIPPPTPNLTISVERDSDMLLLDFLFYGFGVNTATTPPCIQPISSNNTIVVRFPPQSIGEAAYYSPPSNKQQLNMFMDPPPILSAVSGPSQLSFTLPAGATIPLPTMTANDLLDWSGWTLQAMPVAQVNGPTLILGQVETLSPSAAIQKPTPTAPGLLDTYIEAPYALFLSPTVYESGSPVFGFDSNFVNRVVPGTSTKKVTEVFTSSLQRTPIIVFEGSAPEETPQVSAIWSRDFTYYDPGHNQAADVTPEEFIYYGPQIT